MQSSAFAPGLKRRSSVSSARTPALPIDAGMRGWKSQGCGTHLSIVVIDLNFELAFGFFGHEVAADERVDVAV